MSCKDTRRCGVQAANAGWLNATGETRVALSVRPRCTGFDEGDVPTICEKRRPSKRSARPLEACQLDHLSLYNSPNRMQETSAICLFARTRKPSKTPFSVRRVTEAALGTSRT